MNHIYKVIFCKATGTFIAVAEFAKSQGKGSGSVRGNTKVVRAMLKLTSLSSAILVCLGISGQAMAENLTDTTGGQSFACKAMVNSTPVNRSFVCGPETEAYYNVSENGGVAVGIKANSTGPQSVSFGSRVEASGINATAIGNDTIAAGRGSVAFGGDDAGKDESKVVPLGYGYYKDTPSNLYRKTLSLGTGSTAVGSRAQALTDDSLAFGNGATAGKVSGKKTSGLLDVSDYEGGSATALGANSWAQAEKSVAVGSQSIADRAALSGTINVKENATVANNEVYAVANTKNSYKEAIKNTVKGNFGALSIGDTTDTSSIKTRQLTGLAAGSADTDAVNVAQLRGVANQTTYFHVNPDSTAATDLVNNNSGSISDTAGAQGAYSLAAGVNARAKADKSVATGYYASVYGNNGVAIGNGSVAGAGFRETGTYTNSIAIGNRALALRDSSIAIGDGANTGDDATQGIAIGKDAAVNRNSIKSIAIGSNSKAKHFYNLALGVNTVTNSTHATALGTNSEAIGQYSLSAAGAKVVGNRSVALGHGNKIGFDNGVSKDRIYKHYSTAVGQSNNIQAERSAALGISNRISADSSVAIGDGNNVSGTQSIAVGKGHRVSGDYSGAFGDPTTITGDNSYAVGNNNNIGQANTFVLGNSVTTSQKNSVILGNLSTDREATPENDATVNGITYSGFAGIGSPANGVVSVGSKGGERQLINVAAGKISSDSTDAINGSQLYAVADKQVRYYSVNDGATPRTDTTTNNNKDNKGAVGVNALAAGVGANAVGDNAVAVGKDAKALTTDAIVIGRGAKNKVDPTGNARKGDIVIGSEAFSGFTDTTQTSDTHLPNTVLGYQASAVSSHEGGAVSIGAKAKGNTVGAIAIGVKAEAAGKDSNGDYITNSQQGGSIAIGREAQAIFDSSTKNSGFLTPIAIGTQSKALSDGAVAIGEGAESTHQRSVALGSGSVTDVAVSTSKHTINGTKYDFAGSSADSTLSIGKAGQERTLTNLAAGRISNSSTDAINGSQLFAVTTALEKTDKFAVKYDQEQTDPSNPDLSNITFKGATVVADKDSATGVITTDGGTSLKNVASAGDYTKEANADKAVNAGDLNNAVLDVTNKGLTFEGDNNAVSVQRKLGETLKITGGADQSKLTDNNIGVTGDSTDGLKVQLAKDLKGLESIALIAADATTPTQTNKLKLDAKEGTLTGLTNKTWSGTAVSGRAATEDQLQAIADTPMYFHVNTGSNTGGDANSNKGKINEAAGATGTYSLAAGMFAKAQGLKSTAVGNSAKAEGSRSTAIGDLARAKTNESVAVGLRASALGGQSTALGNDALAQGYASMSSGGNRSAENDLIKPGSEYLQYTQPTAENGDKIGIYETLPSVGKAFRRNIALGDNSQSWGTHAQALHDGSIAFGLTATAGDATGELYGEDDGQRVQGVKSFNKISGAHSVAIGTLSYAQKDNSVALGKQAYSSKDDAVALGSGSVADRAALDTSLATFAVSQKDDNASKNQVYAMVGSEEDKVKATVKGNLGAVSVGDTSDTDKSKWKTRQITGLAAGSDDTDAVNVAQLKSVANNAIGRSELPVVYTDQDGNKVYKVGDNFYNNKQGIGDVIVPSKIVASVKNADGSTNARTTLRNVKAGTADDHAVNVSQLNAAAKAAKTEVEAGNNVTVTDNTATKAVTDPTIYTVNAEKSTVTQGDGITVTATDKGKDITDYAVSLNQASKDSLAKADSAVQEVVTQIDGVDVKTINKDNKAANFVTGDNIVLSNESGSIKVATAKEVNFDSVTAGTGGNQVVLNNDGVNVGGANYISKAGLNANNNKISNVKAGDVSKDSTDAVNGGQLHTTNTKVTANQTAINQGLNFAGNEGNFNRQLGDKVSIKGGLDKARSASNSNIRTIADSSGNIDILLADAPTFAGKVSAQGIDAGNQRITGVAKGTADTDAVNVSQLTEQLSATEKTTSVVAGNNTTVSKDVQGNNTEYTINAEKSTVTQGDGITVTATDKGKDITDYAVSLNQASKDSLAKADSAVQEVVTQIDGVDVKTINKDNKAANFVTGDNIVLSNESGSIKVATAKDVNFDSVTAGTGGNQVVLNNDGVNVGGNTYISDAGINANNNKISNVAKGEISKDSTDAINGSQLNSSVDSVADILGGGTTNNAGSIDGKFNVNGTNYDTVAEAIGKQSVASKTEVVEGDNITVTSTDAADGHKIYTVKTKDDVSFNTVTAGAGTSRVVLDDKGVNVGGNTYISDAGINANNNKISNVAKGEISKDSTDAVNGGQLFDTANSITNVLGGNAVNKNGVVTITDIGGTGKDTIDDAIRAIDSKAGVKTTVSAGKNIIVTKNGNDYEVATSDNVSFDSVDANTITAKDGNGNSTTLTANGTTVTDKEGNQAQYDASGITITPAESGKAPVSVSANGLDNGGNVIRNVGTGQADTDAVNVAQLTNAIGEVTTQTVEVKTELENIEKNVIGNVDKDGKPVKVKTFNVANQSINEDQTIIEAINHMNEEGIQYFHTNGADTNANKPTGKTQDSSAQAARSTAIGVQAAVGADATDSLAIGSHANVADNAKSAVAIGHNAKANTENSVALGAGSVADKPVAELQAQSVYGSNYAEVAGVGKDVAGEVSVGAPNATRRVSNVSAGAAPTDAVNVSQLAALDNKVNNSINALGYKVNDVEKQANAGISSAMAMASLPQAYLPGKSMISGGIASYNGEGAVAVGVSKLSDNGRWVFKMNGSADTQGNAGASAGIGMHW
ncbi:ESPR-type extended signal peptide-containing protein [Psychrobacter sp. I-STPA6b]|uniref:ESPR-type extended signal peptide-containing protein n=1 Tax=Psychrobacter sp. I-STPA6b TaxID=2585718 RepID=UPI001D0C010B|nr:YadA-like family protein [Psychrobacter sp. I-STPA6b]